MELLKLISQDKDYELYFNVNIIFILYTLYPIFFYIIILIVIK